MVVVFHNKIQFSKFLFNSGDVEQEIDDEKKKQQELDAQIREMEKKVKEQLSQGGDHKSSGSKKTGGSQKQKSTRKLEDQLQLASIFIVIDSTPLKDFFKLYSI